MWTRQKKCSRIFNVHVFFLIITRLLLQTQLFSIFHILICVSDSFTQFRLEHEKQRPFSCTIFILRLICLPPIKDFLVSSIGYSLFFHYLILLLFCDFNSSGFSFSPAILSSLLLYTEHSDYYLTFFVFVCWNISLCSIYWFHLNFTLK